MSKPYRIRVNEMIGVQDFSTFQIEQIPMVSEERFADLIAAVLVEAGWTPNEDGLLSYQGEHGETYIFHPECMQIQTCISDERKLDKDIEGWDNHDVENRASAYIDRQTEIMEEQVANQLSESQKDRISQFESYVTEATGRALKELAEQMGEVQDIHEVRGENGSYQLTISIQEYE
ncbi:MAG: hypothetical protein EP343_10685 [Deltaproteobacteria bacterium]|nr:MAG: hypothetical protein EP343_10685 [Deltaproteobacteria bacterium]